MKRALTSLLLAVVAIVGIREASASTPVFLRDFLLHNFDTAILHTLGHDSTASITYFRELGSITPDQLKLRTQYEKIGCHPFYVFKGGKIDELGFNCRSFFCVGYNKGPKVCRDTDGKAYSGVVEISRRLSLVTISDIQKPFSEYPAADQTSSMRAQIEKYKPLRCSPLYLLDFDVVVGEGFGCEEVGSYPYYSAKNTCIDDFRDPKGLQCTVPLRADEFEKRADAIAKWYASTQSSSSSQSSTGTGSSSSSVSSAMSSSSFSSSSSSVRVFPDVLEGKYGYTAIMDLTARGIIRGYADGTFRPKNAVNRAEFTKVLLETLYPDQIRSEYGCFRDVTDQWYAVVVCAAKRLGWVSGYGDNTFRAGQTMLKSEAMKVIIEALGAPLDSSAILPEGVAEGQWYTPYVRKAVELDIILESSFQPNGMMSRADAAVWIYRALKAQDAGLVPTPEFSEFSF